MELGCCHLGKSNGVIIVTKADPFIRVSLGVLQALKLERGHDLCIGDVYYKYLTQDEQGTFIFERKDETPLPHFTTMAEW